MKFVQWDNMHRKTILILQPEWNGTCISLSENVMVFCFFFYFQGQNCICYCENLFLKL